MPARSRSSKQAKKESPDGTELLVQELQEIYSAETQLSRILPRLAKAAESETLREMLEQREAEGERILGELNAAFDDMDESPGRKKNVAAEGLINDAREHVQELEEGPALDAVLIGAIQKTEHYCIAAWGTARSLAEALEQQTAARAMERALKEGKRYDEQLTELAEQEVTPALLAEGTEETEEGEEGVRAQPPRRKDGRAERHTRS